jgi:hypothetical protein
MNMQTALTSAAHTSGAVAVKRGRYILKIDGTLGSGTVTLTWCETSGGTYVAIGTGVSLAAAGTTEFDTDEGFIKADLSGSTGATVNWGIAGIVGRAASDA